MSRIYTVRDNYGLAGWDGANAGKAVTDSAACQAMCEADKANCVSWSFDKNTKACWPHTTFANGFYNTNFVSGYTFSNNGVELIGGPAGGEYTLKCNPGSYVTDWYVNSGSEIDGMAIACGTKDKPTSQDLRNNGALYGGGGGGPTNKTSPDGYSGVYVSGRSDVVSFLRPVDANGNIQSSSGNPSASTSFFSCPPGTKVSGVTIGADGARLRKFGRVHCSPTPDTMNSLGYITTGSCPAPTIMWSGFDAKYDGYEMYNHF